MSLYTAVSSQSPHRHSEHSSYSLNLTLILFQTHYGFHPVHFLLSLRFECGMLFGGPWARPLPPYLVQYLQPVGFFFWSLVSSRPLLLRLQALRDGFIFLIGGGGGDWDVDGEGGRKLCRLSLYFCFCRPLCGARPFLSEVVTECALYSSLSD